MSSKVMVTGASGWLGQRLVRRLISQKKDIVYVDYWNGKPKAQQFLDGYNKLKVICGDIRKSDEFIQEFDDCETVFNCAGIQHPVFTKSIYSVNRDGPASLLESCIKMGVKNFIHVSSSTVHGENISKNFITEKSPIMPLTHYAISKIEGERLLAKLSKKSSVRIVIIRPGVFYGVNPSKNLIQLIRNIEKNVAIIFNGKGFLRTYVDIEKVVDALILVQKYGKNTEAYLIGDAKPITTLDLYQIIADEMDVKLKVVRLPKSASRIFEKISFISGKINIHLRIPNIIGEFGRNHYFSSQKAVKEIHYNPHKSSEKGLREMVRFVWKKS